MEAAHPTHPSLIDHNHVVADLYNMVNVPTAVWIDEQGHIVHPNDVTFGLDKSQREMTGTPAERHLNALRKWVIEDEPAISPEKIGAYQYLPSPELQQARALFRLGQWLYDQGERAAAADYFERAGALAPQDFTIRRGTMPMRGLDPSGPQFVDMVEKWRTAGNSFYRPLDW